MNSKDFAKLVDSAIIDGKIAESKFEELRGKAKEAGISDDDFDALVKKRIAVYEAQHAKGLFGLTYQTRIKIWTGLFAAAIIVWIIYKLIK